MRKISKAVIRESLFPRKIIRESLFSRKMLVEVTRESIKYFILVIAYTKIPLPVNNLAELKTK